MKFQSEKKELWRYASKNLTAPVCGTIRQLPLPHRLPPQLHPQSRELPMITQSSSLALLGCYDVYCESSASTATILREGNVSTPPPPYSSLSDLDCSNSVTVPNYTLTFRHTPTYHTYGERETTESETGFSRTVVPVNRDGCGYANTGDVMYVVDQNKLNENSTSSSYQLTSKLQKKVFHISLPPTTQLKANLVALTTTLAATTTASTSTTSFAATAVKILRNCCGGTLDSSNTFTFAPSNSNNNNTCNKTSYQYPENGLEDQVVNIHNYPPEQCFNTLMKQLKASQISFLLKAVKSRQDQIFSVPVSASTTPSSTLLRHSNCVTDCILVRRAEILGEEPYVIACRLFFWRDLKNSSQLKRLPVCPNERDPVYVCCNPLHWCRILETGENSLNNVNPSADSDCNRKNHADVQQQISESANTGCEDSHFVEVAIEEERLKTSTLMRAVGLEAYGLLRELCFPELPANKKYKELCGLLHQHYSPHVIIFRERRKFFDAKKREDEYVSLWYARLKKLAMECKFGSQLQEFVLNKFVTGFEGKIFERLCEEDDALTLEAALKKALTMEVKLYSQTNTSEEVNYVQKHTRGSKKYYANNNNREKAASSGKNNKKVSKNKCIHCGWNHVCEKCKFKSSVCHKCHKMGHLASVCRANQINVVQVSNKNL